MTRRLKCSVAQQCNGKQSIRYSKMYIVLRCLTNRPTEYCSCLEVHAVGQTVTETQHAAEENDKRHVCVYLTDT